MLILSISLVGVKYRVAYPKLHASCLFTCRRQILSLMSRLEKRNGCLGLYLSAKVAMSLFTHGPNCIVDYSGACFVSAKLK